MAVALSVTLQWTHCPFSQPETRGADDTAPGQIGEWLPRAAQDSATTRRRSRRLYPYRTPANWSARATRGITRVLMWWRGKSSTSGRPRTTIHSSNISSANLTSDLEESHLILNGLPRTMETMERYRKHLNHWFKILLISRNSLEPPVSGSRKLDVVYQPRVVARLHQTARHRTSPVYAHEISTSTCVIYKILDFD